MAVLTRPRPTILAVPLRGIALLSGLLSCGLAPTVSSPFFAVTQFAFGALLLLAAVAPLRRAMPIFIYAGATMAFVRIRGFADNAGVPVSFDYPIAFEKTLFGDVLSIWIQDLLYVPGRIGALDVFLVGVYYSYFLAPAAAALLLWRFSPTLFPRLAWALAITLTLGLLIYALIPTAPPWLASEAGDIGTVHRVVPQLTAVFAGDAYEEAAATLDKNPVAAMPSLHTALTVVIAAVMAKFGAWWKRAGIAYVAVMCLALVYLGEHYLIDELAGIALGLGAWGITARFSAAANATVPVEVQEIDERTPKAPVYPEAA